MRTVREGFLQDIRDHPGDDFPRLIFSDWLEENGEEEFAEFIRLQIRWHRKRNECTQGVRKRWQKLLRENACEWWRYPFKARWVRGFPHEARCRLEEWDEYGPGAVTEHPIGRVTLTNWEPEQEDDGLWGYSYLITDRSARRFNQWLNDTDRNVGQHPSPAQARQALSRELLNWARDRAGLPLLTFSKHD